jgi:hypothetical protein
MGKGVIDFMLGMQAPFPQQARHLTKRFGEQPTAGGRKRRAQ